MIEELRYLLRSNPGLYLAQVTEVSDLDDDKSEYLLMLKLLPDRGDIVAPQAFDDEKLQVGDVVLVAVPADEVEYATVIAVLPNTTNTIHERTDEGHRVLKARTGKKLNLVSDTRINIGKGGDAEESEPLVLGNVLITYLSQLVTRFETACDKLKTCVDQTKTALDAIKIGPATDVTGSAGNPSPISAAIVLACTTASTALATLSTEVSALKSGIGNDKGTYLDDAGSNIVSQLAFTERGGD